MFRCNIFDNIQLKKHDFQSVSLAFWATKQSERRTWRTEGTERISEKAKREGCEVASATRAPKAEPWRADARFTKCSIRSACFCSMSISLLLLCTHKTNRILTKNEPNRRKRVFERERKREGLGILAFDF